MSSTRLTADKISYVAQNKPSVGRVEGIVDRLKEAHAEVMQDAHVVHGSGVPSSTMFSRGEMKRTILVRHYNEPDSVQKFRLPDRGRTNDVKLSPRLGDRVLSL